MSYLNARPLIDGVASAGEVEVVEAVPSRLAGLLHDERLDVALLPVVDYFRSPEPLAIIPAGAIGCDGPTLTVRLFSRVPVDRVRRVYADSDSHTSVALATILLTRLTGRRPELTAWRAPVAPGGAAHRASLPDDADAMLLIGDKVVTASPDERAFAHGLDLGAAWREATGLPFVFAAWAARAGAELGDLPRRLAAARRRNLADPPGLARRHAARHGWPVDLAARYLGDILRYEFGERQIEAVERFGAEAHALGLLDAPPVVRLHHPLRQDPPAVPAPATTDSVRPAPSA